MSDSTAALSSAFSEARRILFDPFDAQKYLGLAVCMWLSQLGGFVGAWPGYRGREGPYARGEAPPNLDELTAELAPWAPLIGLGVVALTVLAVALGVAILALQSRGTFMVIDNLVKHAGAVEGPWRAFAAQANSLFRFRLVLAAVGLLAGLFTAALVFAGVWYGGAGPVDPMRASLATAGAVSTGLVVLGVALLDGCATEFVAPLMYARRYTTTDGFRDLGRYVRDDLGAFVVYVLLRIVVAMGAGLITVVVATMTCGVALLPFVGTVILLPIAVYVRLFSLHFMAGQADDLRYLGPSGAPSGDIAHA
jgi:hypothetical protein